MLVISVVVARLERRRGALPLSLFGSLTRGWLYVTPPLYILMGGGGALTSRFSPLVVLSLHTDDGGEGGTPVAVPPLVVGGFLTSIWDEVSPIIFTLFVSSITQFLPLVRLYAGETTWLFVFHMLLGPCFPNHFSHPLYRPLSTGLSAMVWELDLVWIPSFPFRAMVGALDHRHRTYL